VDLIGIGIGIAVAFWCACIAARKGHSPILWAILGLVFPIIALLPAKDRPAAG
jgi:hypothetical protein